MMVPWRFLVVLLLAALAGMGCSVRGRPGKDATYLPSQIGGGVSQNSSQSTANLDIDSFWDGDGVAGTPHIIIDLSDQMAYFYKGSQKVGVSRISSGQQNIYDTPVGEFKVIQKDKTHKSSLYGNYVFPDGTIAKKDIDVTKDKKPPGTRFDGSDMPYFMRFTNGVGLHAGFLPGFRVPASHGCVRMPERMAKTYFENADVGTPVTVRR